MGWTAHYQVLRGRALDAAETKKLTDYVEKANDTPWDGEAFRLAIASTTRRDRVIADGWQKLPFDHEHSEDHQRLCKVLNELRTVLKGAKIRIRDDYEMFGFDDGRVSLDGDLGPEPVEVDASEFLELKSKTRPKKGLASRGSKSSPSPAEVGKALIELSKVDYYSSRREKLAAKMDQLDPLVVAQVGLAKRRQIGNFAAWTCTLNAIDRLDDISPVIEPFLDMWNARHGVYWHHDLSLPNRTRTRLVRDPRVEAQMRSDLDKAVRGGVEEVEHRCAELAAGILACAESPSSRATLIGAARKLRSQKKTFYQDRYTYAGVLRALADANIVAGVPSILLALARPRPPTGTLDALGQMAGRKCLPIFRAYAATGCELYSTIQGLMHAGDIETITELASVEEEHVATALEKLGRPAPKIPPLQQLVVHPFDFVRRSAIYHLENEMNPRWMLSLLAAKTLVVKIAQRYRSTVDMEDRTPELLPDALKHQSYAKQLAAVRAGKVPELGEQEIWPSIVPILNGDVAALAATYAHPKKPDPCEPIVAFSASCAAALSAEEAAMLKAFKAGTKPPKLDLTPVVLAGIKASTTRKRASAKRRR